MKTFSEWLLSENNDLNTYLSELEQACEEADPDVRTAFMNKLREIEKIVGVGSPAYQSMQSGIKQIADQYGISLPPARFQGSGRKYF